MWLWPLALGWYFKGQPSYCAGDVPANTAPSVAVLPFANMSGKPAYWRDKGWTAGCRPLGETDFECGVAAAPVH